MYHSVLVPLDGSVFAECALPIAISIARASNARLELITVDFPIQVFGAGLYTVDTDLENPAFAHPSMYLQATADRITKSTGLHVTPVVRVGPISHTIARHARQTETSLIVMTTHGRGPLRRMWLGSVAVDVVRESAVPVLLIRPTHGPAPELAELPKFHHILVPLDASAFSEEVLTDVTELGKLWGARFTFLQVVEPGHITGVPTEAIWLPIDESTVAEGRMRATTYLKQIAQRFSKRDLPVDTAVVVESHAASAILDFAEHSGIDLIALTTHGRGGLGRLVLGSVADKIMRAAPVPVLLYRPRGVQ